MLSQSTPIALALCYIEQDPVGFKVLMSDVGQSQFMDLLQESLMWNARFLQKAGHDIDMQPQEIARQIIAEIRMKEMQ